MSFAKKTFQQIERLTTSLIEVSLCDDQNAPVKLPNVPSWDTCRIDLPVTEVSIALRNIPYDKLYGEMNKRRIFTYKLIDGALLSLQYDFFNGVLNRHRLGYYPNPNLLSFQENEDLYSLDDIYLDIIDRRIVIVPIRFDYDCSDDTYEEIEHPKSHFTLGQFENCRIPVSRPLTPCQFVHFILRNFYHHAYTKYKDKLFDSNDYCFDETD